MTEWRPIPGYDGVFEASDDGEIRRTVRAATVSLSRVAPYLMTKTLDRGTGYYRVGLSYKGNKKLDHVHRLVLMAFVGDPPKGFHGAHLNGVKTDNRLSNLMWASPKENMSHKHLHGTAQTGEKANSSKLKDADIPKIFGMRVSGAKQTDLAEKYGISQAAIWSILARKTWTHVPIPETVLKQIAAMPRDKRACEYCGREFDVMHPRQRYCGAIDGRHLCKDRSRRRQPLANAATRTLLAHSMRNPR